MLDSSGKMLRTGDQRAPVMQAKRSADLTTELEGRAYAARRRVRRVGSLLAVTGGLAALCAGCGGSSRAAAVGAAGGRVLTIGLSVAPKSLNPAIDGNGAQTLSRTLALAAITHMNPDGSIAPGLATRWGYVGKGNTRFWFTLRHDARFSDGRSVTAAAVKAWLDYFNGAHALAASLMGPIRSVSTHGRWTVEIDLSAPNPNLPTVLSEAQNWGSVEDVAHAAPSSLGTQTDGAGPYVVSSAQSVAGDHYTYLPNRYYYDKSAIHYAKVVVKVISTPSSMLEALQAGQIDVAAYGDSSTVKAATAIQGVHVVAGSNGAWGLAFTDIGGSIAKPLASLKVRQAVNYAINRPVITKAFVGSYGRPTSEMASSDGFVARYANYYSYDPRKAKALLAAAGYPHGFSLRVADQQNGSLGDPVVQAIAKYLAAVGIKLKITTAPTFAQFAQLVSGHTFPVEMYGSSFGRSMWTQYGIDFAPKSLFNPFGWSDPAMVSLNARGTSGTPATAAADARAMSIRSVTQADWLNAFLYDNIYYVTDRVGGVDVTSANAAWPTEWYSK